MLVKRVARLCIVAQCVERERPQTSAVLVESAALVPQSEVAVGRPSGHVVAHGAGSPAPIVGVRTAIGREGWRVGRRPFEAERPHANANVQRRRLQHDFVLTLIEIEPRPFERGHVEAVAALPRNVGSAGRDHPCPRLAQSTGRNQQHAHQVGGEHEQPTLPAIVESEPRAVCDTLDQ